MKEEEIKYKIELLCSKYEIETLEPNEIIKDWFKDFENDMMYIFNEGQLQAKEDFLKMLDELLLRKEKVSFEWKTPNMKTLHRGTDYVVSIDEIDKLKQKLQEKK